MSIKGMVEILPENPLHTEVNMAQIIPLWDAVINVRLDHVIGTSVKFVQE